MVTEMKSPDHISAVLSGGGCRAFWSLGALHRMERFLPLVSEWAGVSAGSAMAAACCAGKMKETRDYFSIRTDANEANFYPLNIFNRQPVFPQEVIYTPEAPISYNPVFPLVFIAVSTVIGLLAAALPAMRAGRIDPVETLRDHG